jgi:hypothetical protein
VLFAKLQQMQQVRLAPAYLCTARASLLLPAAVTSNQIITAYGVIFSALGICFLTSIAFVK